MRGFSLALAALLVAVLFVSGCEAQSQPVSQGSLITLYVLAGLQIVRLLFARRSC